MGRWDLPITSDLVVVRGGGDLATGVVQKLHRAGIKVVVLEQPKPTVIRRTVALATAVRHSAATVEDLKARLVNTPRECAPVWAAGEIPVLVDPQCLSLDELQPNGLVDAILAKKNLGTHAKMAPIVLALGPGFSAPDDAHAVIETMRGHSLGQVIFKGTALPDTGTPEIIGDKGKERVLRAPRDGVVKHLCKIGDKVEAGQEIFTVDGQAVTAPFTGILRGLIEEGLWVPKGMKTADIDPRLDTDCFTISDKARAVGGAVLEAYLYFRKRMI